MPRRLRSWSSKNSVNVTLQPRATIEDLPDEVLLRVMSYVDQEELLSTIPLVCKHWDALHGDHSLYRTLEFEYNKPTTAVAIKMLSLAPWLTSLTLIYRRDTDELLRHVGPNHPHLAKLIVRSCTGSPDKVQVTSTHLINVASNCKLLQNVSLVEISCGNSTFYQQMGQMLPNLRIIDLGILNASNPGTLTHIVKYLNTIEEMRIGCSYLTLGPIPAEEVLAFVKRFRESLSVFDFKDKVVWSDVLLTSVAQCLNLRELNLEDAANVTDNGLMAISHLINVRHLRMLQAHKITTQCWLRFVHTPLMRRLQTLFLHSYNIDVHVVSAIGLALGELVKLNIYANGISFCGRATTLPDLLDSSSRELDLTLAQAETSSLLFPLINRLTVYCSIKLVQVLSLVGRIGNFVQLELIIRDPTNRGIMHVSLLPKLRKLKIMGGHHVSKEAWTRFFVSPNVAQLRRLSMMRCGNVDDAVARAIATNLRELEVLRVSKCKVTEEGQHHVKQLVSERCQVHFP